MPSHPFDARPTDQARKNRLRLPVPPASRPLLGAHRGATLEAPENTMAAFEAAAAAGADLIELDAHPTRDGRLAVIHDVTTSRTTGRAGALQDLTASELARLDAGRGQPIPMLDDVLDWARGRAYLNIDVRNYPFLSYYRMEKTAELVLDTLARTRTAGQVVVQCLDHVLARELRERCPGLAVGVTQHGRPADMVGLAAAAGAQLVGLDAAFVTREVIERLHAAGVAVMTSAELRLPGQPEGPETTELVVRRLVAMGVDVVVADDVTLVASILRGSVREGS